MKTLLITASVVLAMLVLGIAGLAFFPDPNAGDPVVILNIEPAPAPPADAAPAASQSPAAGLAPSGAAAGGEYDVPPGFALEGLPPPGAGPAPQQGLAVSPPDAGTEPPLPPDAGTAGEVPGGTAQPPLVMEAPGSTPEAGAAQPAPQPTLPTGSIEADASRGLDAVPVAELVEESQYGPLPKVSPDGKRALEVYARPSRYAAKAAAGEPARVAVLINGMGLPDSATAEVIKGLPGAISLAYGVYGRNLQDWVVQSRAAGHEVFLQIPLEPQNYPQNDPGPHTLLTTLPREENMKRLQWVMSRFTGYVGVTNHMGGKFEAAQDSFLPVLEELKARGLLYVDDGSSQLSTAGQIATVLGLDYSVANVQIDAGQSPGDVSKALAKLEAVAKERGAAIGIAGAKPATIKQLALWAGQLQAKGIVLVPVSAAVRARRQS